MSGKNDEAAEREKLNVRMISAGLLAEGAPSTRPMPG